ncbi:hypothetical protein ON010_g16184 [Phytophthora cinnamomi]|nr:hypothetical protein ON010_g16184 [Phytophthora cinnamomi]
MERVHIATCSRLLYFPSQWWNSKAQLGLAESIASWVCSSRTWAQVEVNEFPAPAEHQSACCAFADATTNGDTAASNEG